MRPLLMTTYCLEGTNMAPPQLIADFMRLMLLLAPSAAVICLVLAGLSLRQGSVPDALVGGNFAKWMFWAIVFLMQGEGARHACRPVGQLSYLYPAHSGLRGCRQTLC